MKLYHVSPDKNTLSIMIFGIDPEYALGRKKVSYWVERDALLWAISHVSVVHKEQVHRLEVWKMIVPDTKGFINTQWPGVLTTKLIFRTVVRMAAEDVILNLAPSLLSSVEPDDPSI